MTTVMRVAFDDVTRLRWDDLLRGGDFYLSTDWLAAFARARFVPGCRLVAPGDDGTPVAGLPVYVLGIDTYSPVLRPDTTLAQRLHPPAGSDAKYTDPGRMLPALFCGSRRVSRSAMLLGSGHNATDVSALLAAVEQFAREQDCASIFMPYVDASDTNVRQALIAAGFAEIPNDVRADLHLTGGGLESFLAERSGRRRGQIRRDLRQLSSGDVRLSHEPMRESDIPTLGGLAKNLDERYGATRPRAVIESGMHQMLRTPGATPYVTRAHHENVTRGFATFLYDGRDLYAHDAGFDYGFQGRLPLYFGVLFYEAVALAADLDVREIHYGLGSSESKASRGCSLTQLFAYVRAQDDHVHREIRAAVDSELRPSSTPEAPSDDTRAARR